MPASACDRKLKKESYRLNWIEDTRDDATARAWTKKHGIELDVTSKAPVMRTVRSRLTKLSERGRKRAKALETIRDIRNERRYRPGGVGHANLVAQYRDDPMFARPPKRSRSKGH